MFNFVLSQTIMLAFRKGGGAFGALAFYILVFTLFTFALSPEAMQDYALPVMVVAMVLASLVVQPLIFERDAADGMLEQYRIKAPMLEMVVLAKLIGGWLVQLVPMLFASFLLSVMAGLDAADIRTALISLTLLSPSLAAVNMLSASLTLGSKRGGLLPALVSLPLLVPLIILASHATGGGAILLLAAAALVSVPVSCFISSMILKLY